MSFNILDPGLPSPSPTPSYWQTPSTIFPTPQSIPDEIQDYAIIGSGITGAMTAYNILHSLPNDHNNNDNIKIVILEARGLCSGATGRNGGHTKSGAYRVFKENMEKLGGDVGSAVGKARFEYNNVLALHSFIRSKNWESLCDLRSTQTVDIYFDEAQFTDAVGKVEFLRSCFPPGDPAAEYTIHSRSEVTEVFKCPEAVGGISYTAGSLKPYAFVCAVLKECVELGLKAYSHTPVTSIIRGEDGLWNLTTERGVFKAKNVVLATNGYTSHLMPTLRGSIVPFRGQVTVHRPPITSFLLNPRLSHTYSFVYEGGYDYMIQEPRRGDIIIGGGFAKAGKAEIGVTDDTSINPIVTDWLKGTMRRYYGRHNWVGGDGVYSYDNKEEESEVVNEWTGIMGFSADGFPWVGRVPGSEGGLWMAAGFQGHGMVLTFLCARALVDMMMKKDEGKLMSWFPKPFVASEERLKTKFTGDIR